MTDDEIEAHLANLRHERTASIFIGSCPSRAWLQSRGPTLARLALDRGKEIERLRAALEQGAQWFDEYAASHAAKGADDKAARNAERAAYLRAALNGGNDAE